MMDKPKRTSFSSISTFESCPLSYKLYYLDGHDTPAGAAASRGTRLHTACERYLLSDITVDKLPLDFSQVRHLLEEMREKGAHAEAVWLVDKAWGFQLEEDDDTRIKAIVDIHYRDGAILHIVDLKTGNKYPEHADQLQIYAAMGFAAYPDVEAVHVSCLYLEGQDTPTVYPRALAPHLQEFWMNRAQLVLDAVEYPPTPSVDACKWCGYRKSKGGQCSYG